MTDQVPERTPNTDGTYDSGSTEPSGRKQATRGMDDGWTVTGTLITGIGFWGLVGWGLSEWTGWIGWLAIGVLLGAFAGVYLVVKQVSAPPPLLDISKAQDGGLAAWAQRKRAEQRAARDAESPEDRRPDEGHTDQRN